MRSAATKRKLRAGLAADESGARQMRDGDRKLPLLVAHDDDDALGERGDVVPARAAVEVAHPALFFGQRRVDVAEAVDFERAEETRIDHPAMKIHSHHIEESAPACRTIENARVGKTDGRILRSHVGDANFQERRQARRVRALRKETRDLRQAEADDHDLAVFELAGARGSHDLGGANLCHLQYPNARSASSVCKTAAPPTLSRY